MFLNYGQEKIELKLPSGVSWELIENRSAPSLKNPREAIIASLRSPAGTPPLRQIAGPGETVCLLVNDNTRLARSELFLPLLIDELLSGGVSKKDIFIVFTNGTHRPLTEAEMIELTGPEIAAGIKLFNHDSRDQNELVFMGETGRGTPVLINRKVAGADRRILTGSVLHHYFAGFGGGRKALVPGVAGWDTIRKNHSLMLDERAVSGRLNGNPLHEDLLEAALMVGGDFLLNTVLDEKKDVLGVFAGGMIETHLEACALVERVNGTALKGGADVIIASCGGYPKDINLYQAHKALDNALKALKPGGSLVLLAECPDGIGSRLYEEWAQKYQSLAEMEAALRDNFILGGHKAFTVGKLLQQGNVYLVSALPPEKARTHGFTPADSLESALKDIYGNRRNLLTYVIPQASITVPQLSANGPGSV